MGDVSSVTRPAGAGGWSHRGGDPGRRRREREWQSLSPPPLSRVSQQGVPYSLPPPSPPASGSLETADEIALLKQHVRHRRRVLIPLPLLLPMKLVGRDYALARPEKQLL